MTVKVGVAPPTIQMTVQAEYLARSFGADAVAPVEVIVTPDPAAKVVKPTPIDCTSKV